MCSGSSKEIQNLWQRLLFMKIHENKSIKQAIFKFSVSVKPGKAQKILQREFTGYTDNTENKCII